MAVTQIKADKVNGSAGKKHVSVLREFDRTFFLICEAVKDGNRESFLVGNAHTGPLLTVGKRRAERYVERFRPEFKSLHETALA